MRDYIPDALDLWEAKDRSEARALAQLPVCDRCGHVIQECDFYDIYGQYFCRDCLDDQFRREVEV